MCIIASGIANTLGRGKQTAAIAAPPPPPPPLNARNPETQRQLNMRQNQQAKNLKSFKGQGSTLLTSPLGVQEDAQISTKTLLGQ